MSPIKLELFSELTWKKLRPDPLYNYEYYNKNESGQVLIQAHKDFIQCLIGCDFDVRKATKVYSKNQGVWEDLSPEGQDFRTKLAEMLKDLVKQHGT